MKKIIEISLLLDFYGQLLTVRQYEILDLHINNDYSLGEIAENLNISRQGVYDNIKRGKAALNKFEMELGLVEKFSEQKEKALEILEYIKDLNTKNLNDNDKINIKKIKEGILFIIEK